MRTTKATLIGLALLVVLLLGPTIALSAETNTTTTTPPANTTGTTTAKKTQQTEGGANEIFKTIGNLLKPGKSASVGVAIFMIAMVGVITLYLWHLIPQWVGGKPSREKAWAQSVKITPPRGYDFVTYVVDNAEKTVSKDYFAKISESLYMSTSLTKPSFLYIPEHTDTYLCREGKTMVPCGLAYREGLLTILVDPKLASAHDLAISSGLISIEDKELDKLLSELYKKGEKKLQEIPITPDTKIGFVFNIKNMIKGYLSILRSADEMMIHFLHTANQSESIEKFMKTAVKMQEAKMSWLRYVAYFILMMALGIALVMVVK